MKLILLLVKHLIFHKSLNLKINHLMIQILLNKNLF